MSSHRRGRFDWRSVRNKLRTDDWLLLGERLPYSIYVAIAQNRIAALRDAVEVRTTNTDRAGGTRTCDVYLRLRKDGSDAPSSDGRGSPDS